MVEAFLSLLIVSFAIERIVEYIYTVKVLYDLKDKFTILPLKVWTSLGLSLGAAYYANIDFIKLVVESAKPSLFGLIMTGLLISGGSNVINDIISKIKEINVTKTK
jgi:hypothetical protein